MKTVTTKEIAEMAGVTRATATNRLVKRPDFPKPVVDLSQRLKQWSESDVMRYFKSGRRCK